MDDESVLEKIKPILRQYWLPIAVGILGLIFLGYGLIYSLGSDSANSNVDDIVFEAGENSETSVKTIMVDVEGAVVNPGVYSLEEDARLQDALVAAGGFSASADREWIAKSLNLAAKLADSTKIYIPSIGEDKSTVNSGASVTGVSTTDTGGLININNATSKELDTLPGIGPVTAGKIIDNRPYSSVEDLLNNKIVGNKVFSDIKDRITAY